MMLTPVQLLRLISLSLLVLWSFTLHAQEEDPLKRKIEVGITYTLHRPFYSVNNPLDIVALPKAWRMRNALRISARYYPFEHWFVEASTGYSQEGGGYAQQHTNANYWKNGLYLGYSAKHHRKVIFETYTGIESSVLMSAKFKDKNSKTVENVRPFFRNTYTSIPFGIGLKTPLNNDTFLTLRTSGQLGMYEADSQTFIKAAQIIFPSFQVSVSKFIK